MADAEKRGAERLPILGELQAEIMVFQPMLIRDISRDGITIETQFPLQLDSLHDVRLTLGDRSVVVKARVVHSRISNVDQDVVRYSSGLEFAGVPARVLDVIGAFVAAEKDTRSGV